VTISSGLSGERGSNFPHFHWLAPACDCQKDRFFGLHFCHRLYGSNFHLVWTVGSKSCWSQWHNAK